MAKHKPEFSILSYGIYSKWEESSKKLPQIQQFTLIVPAKIDIEFGFIINIKRAKNQKIHYCIDHPQIPDEDGHPLPPFIGEVFIKSNNWDFFLGDTIWEPAYNKVGPWKLSLSLNEQTIAKKTFTIVESDLPLY